MDHPQSSSWPLRGLFKYGDGGDGAIVKKARQTGRQPQMFHDVSLSSIVAEHLLVGDFKYF